MRWTDISEKSRQIMTQLGDYTPSARRHAKEVIGSTVEASDRTIRTTYWTSGDLRKIAAACIEVADWLDERAADKKGKE